MATESPMRIVESSGTGKWASSKDTGVFASHLNNIAADELGMFIKGQKFDKDQRNVGPDRSGSAPPSMEGAFAAFGYLMAQHGSSRGSSLASISSVMRNSQSEEQLRSDPSYFEYYWSNINLNPRLPPPIMSRENHRLVRRAGGFGNNRRFTSFDDSGDGSSHLSTHQEEPEDDRSPQKALEDPAESGGMLTSGQNEIRLAGRHKSLVDLIQEDFPRTPSPVYNHPLSSVLSTPEEPIDRDIRAISLDNLSINTQKLTESKPGSVTEVHTDAANAHGFTVNDGPSVVSVPRKSHAENIGCSPPPRRDELINKEASLRDGAFARPRTGMDSSGIRLAVEDNKKKQERQFYEKNVNHQHPYPVRGTANQLYGSQIVQGVNHKYNGMDKVPHGGPSISSVDVQQPPPGLAPPLYATAASFVTSGNPYFPTISPPGLYAPQYSMGGYTLGSAFSPHYMAGYPSPIGMPIPFDASSGQSFNGRSPGVSTGESISHVGDFQRVNKFYGQQGLVVQPPFWDPIHMQYFHPPPEDAYGSPGQYGPLASTGLIGAQLDPFAAEKDSTVNAYLGDQKFIGSLSISSPRQGSVGYCGAPSSIGVMTQFSPSPLGSPILPGSPVGGGNHSGRINDLRYSQGSFRNAGVYSGWQGQRGPENFADPKKHSFLEELKSSNGRKIDLSDIAGRIVEFSVDQHGSRFIQQKLEICSPEEKASVFKEVLPHASKLITDVFGNYVIQKFFEHGSPEQRKELADQLSGQMLPLSLQMYGCRVIQKALEVIDVDQKIQLVHELDGHVTRCVRDQNGNHVIQKCIECVPTEEIGFIISAFRGQVATLSTHPYGCRVIQRVLEHCADDSKSQCIVDEILESAYVLAQDQYGNYVTQHVLERGKPQERSQIISKLTGKIVQMSQHKYASNVIEKCLEHGDISERELLIEEILGQSHENDNLLAMMKDQFANYVVQKILEISNDKQREVLINRMRVHLHGLKKYTYGKHIVARFEQFSGEEVQASEP